MTTFAVAALCAIVGGTSHAQVIPASTSGVVYLRSDAVAYPPNYVPASGLANAQVSLAGVVTTADAAGAFALPSSTTPTSNFVSLAASLAGYAPTWYPWVPDDARQSIGVGLYPEVVGTARPGFISGVIVHDAGGFVPTYYRAGDYPTTFDRIKNIVGGNLVTFVDQVFITSYSAVTNTVTMANVSLKAGGADRAMYETLVGQAHARGLQFMMMLGTYPAPALQANYNPAAIPPTQVAFWDAWFAAYQTYVLDKTSIARDLGIEFVTLGFNDDFTTQQPAERWRRLIAAVRANGYTGKLAYFGGMRSPKENDQESHYYDFYGGKDPSAFMRLFDAIGVNIYWVAIPKDGAPNPYVPKEGTPNPYELARSRSAMRDDLRRIFGTLTNAPVPILMMIGSPSVFGGSSDPTYIEPCCIGLGSIANTRTRDYQQQADVYQAAAEIIDESPTGVGRIMGLLTWGYDLRDNLTQLNRPGDSAYDKSGNIRGKPAEAVMRSWFQRWSAPMAPGGNYQGLWWNAPAASESGWGINFAHQGDVIFATWFTYDATGKGLWLSMTANKTAASVYSGTLYQTRGSAFSAVPFTPAAVTATPIGSGTLTFSDGNNGSFAYVVNGLAQIKTITREVFGPLPICTFGAQPNLALATNYQDLWWAAPAEAEAGWGVNFTHQGDIIFATWFTYDTDGTPLWLSATAPKTGTGLYTGTLYRTTGPAFNAVPFLPANVALTPVGTLTLTFVNGNSATFAYTVNGVTQSKPITRQVFRTPGTVCA